MRASQRKRAKAHARSQAKAITLTRGEATRAAAYTKGMEHTAAILATLILDREGVDRLVITKAQLESLRGIGIAITPGDDGELVIARAMHAPAPESAPTDPVVGACGMCSTPGRVGEQCNACPCAYPIAAPVDADRGC